MLSSVMNDESFADDPTYRAGVLMGRQQSITDVMGLLVEPDGASASEKVASVMEWCIQTLEEGKGELKLIVAAVKDKVG